MKKLYGSLTVLHAFMGISAVAGGVGALMDPSGEAMGIGTDALQRGPFRDFLIPGLFLLLVNGMGNLLAALLAHRRFRFQAYLSGLMGVIMMAWIAIQCTILEAVTILHVLYFLTGLAVAVLALLLALRQKLFPLNHLMDRFR